MSILLSRSARRAQPGTARDAHVPFPTGGLNTQAAGSAMPPDDAVALWNLVSAELGGRSRLGYREWCVGLTGLADNKVRSGIPYAGSAKSGSKDRFFVTTSTGIWNCTTQGAVAPAWVGATAYAAYVFVTSNGNVFGATIAGTSAAAGGLPSTWTALTVYAIGDRVINGSHVYVCDTNGTSAAAVGPVGTGADEVDGTTRWDYQSETDAITDGTVTWKYRSTNVAPTLVWTFGTQTGDAGIGVAHAFATPGGHFLAYCDEENGYHLYTESTDTWAQVTLGAGAGQVSADAGTVPAAVDPVNFVAVTSFKGRLWFAEKDSPRAWYLPINAVVGGGAGLGVKPFNFGQQFRAGGHLVNLFNWTLDGGVGIDDHLVAVSGGGDVVIAAGTDPASATTFGLKGVWSLGGVPTGRRLGTNFGGDLLLLSKTGLRPLSQLVSGGDGAGLYLTGKVGNLFNQLMLAKYSLYGWSVQLHPEDNALVITVPTDVDQATEQVAQQLWNRSWSRYRDLPIYSAATWAGKMFFGTVDGRVCVNDGYLDNVRLADGSNTPVQYASITAFRNLGTARMKRLHLIRPTILSDATSPNFDVRAKYRYDLNELATVSGSAAGTGGWDFGAWDSAIWGGDFTPSQQLRGATGCGVDVAIAMRGQAAGRTIIVGWDVTFGIGGVL